MALGPRLDIRQTQTLVLTPQLQQAIRLLQLSNLELEAVIAEEMAKNPLIEAIGGEEDFGQGCLHDGVLNRGVLRLRRRVGKRDDMARAAREGVDALPLALAEGGHRTRTLGSSAA